MDFLFRVEEFSHCVTVKRLSSVVLMVLLLQWDTVGEAAWTRWIVCMVYQRHCRLVSLKWQVSSRHLARSQPVQVTFSNVVCSLDLNCSSVGGFWRLQRGLSGTCSVSLQIKVRPMSGMSCALFRKLSSWASQMKRKSLTFRVTTLRLPISL